MKSHFQFSKKQRSGILLLLLLLLVAQSVYYCIDFTSKTLDYVPQDVSVYQTEIDSLRRVKLENSKPIIFPFNPNYITDFKGYSLGMTNKEIDRLHAFRKKNKWVNSSKDFQKITQVSDSLLVEISPYFKFPDWITNSKPKSRQANNYLYHPKPKTFDQTKDLNTVSSAELMTVYGIGEALSERISAYRARYGGFVADVQLQEVYGLSSEVVQRVLNEYTVKTGVPITKININKATLEQLVAIQYIDYEIAHNIIEQRTLREGFKSFDELTKVKDFPVKKSEIIRLYLTFN